MVENTLVQADITVNKNMVPFDSRSPFQTSGLRIGTPAITTRGLKEEHMEPIVDLIDDVISHIDDTAKLTAPTFRCCRSPLGRGSSRPRQQLHRCS